MIPLMACTASGNSGGTLPTGSASAVPNPITGGAWFRPAVGTTWQWQLTEEINTQYNASVYDIDLDNEPSTIAVLHAQGKKVICYFSAGSYEDFRDDAGQFPENVLGEPLDDYPNERWLDIRSADVLALMAARMDQAAGKGCDGIEPDNVAGYENDSGFDLTAADQLLYNIRIANAAHERNLAVALKNDLDQVAALVAYFDFAVNEQCHEYDECDALQPFLDAGKAVFNAEYDDVYVDNAAARADLCQASASQRLSTLILQVGLDGSFRMTCDN